MTRQRGSRPVFRLLYFAVFLKKKPFLCTVPKKKSAHTGARKSEEKVWNPGGEIREENVFGYSVKKQ